MARYAQIYTQLWFDKGFGTLSERFKLFFIYVLSSPHSNMLGYYRLPLAYAANDLGWTIDQVKAAIRDMAHFIAYDPQSEMLLVKKYLKYNQIENPNQAKGAIKLLEDLPASFLHPIFRECQKLYAPKFDADFETLGEPFWNPSETLPKPVTVTVTETVTETVTDTGGTGGVSPGGDAPVKKPKRKIVYTEEFNSFWQAYPVHRRDNKQKTSRLFAVALEDGALAEEITQSVYDHSRSDKWQEEAGRYVPGIIKFLEGERWKEVVPISGPRMTEKERRTMATLQSFVERHGDADEQCG